MKFGNIMIFGDSYSTYEGHIPEGYAAYYSGHRDEAPDLSDVKYTWWHKLVTKTGATLVQNNSWSGSTICYTGYNGIDCSRTSSFIYRFEKLLNGGFFDENKIDTLLVFGGTNDSWCGAPLGEEKEGLSEESELYCALPAIAHFATRLKMELTDTRVVFIVNTELRDEVSSALKNAALRNSLDYVELRDIEKVNGHPTERGMEQIFEQVLAAL